MPSIGVGLQDKAVEKYCFYPRALWRFADRMGLAWIFLRYLWRVALALHDANGRLALPRQPTLEAAGWLLRPHDICASLCGKRFSAQWGAAFFMHTATACDVKIYIIVSGFLRVHVLMK